MKEEDLIKELFSKTKLNYPTDGIEAAVLKKIEIKTTYRKKKEVYDLIGKFGFLFFIPLCLLFAMIIGKADTFYLFLGFPFMLLLFIFPLEIVFRQKQIS